MFCDAISLQTQAILLLYRYVKLMFTFLYMNSACISSSIKP
jgi:hypothetical protein